MKIMMPLLNTGFVADEDVFPLHLIYPVIAITIPVYHCNLKCANASSSFECGAMTSCNQASLVEYVILFHLFGNFTQTLHRFLPGN